MFTSRLSVVVVGIVVPVMAGLLTACGSSSSDTSAAKGDETTTIRYQGTGGGGMYAELADALGYLDGITLKNIGTTQGGPASIQAVATHQADFGMSFNLAIVAARSAGAKVKGVAGILGTNKVSPSGYYTLEGSPIKNARDLIGKKVGLNTLGAANEAFLDEYLLKNGFDADELKKVKRVVIDASTSELALRNHRVDLVPLTAQQYAFAQKQGGISSLFTMYDLLGDFTQASYVMSDDFIKDNPVTARAFVSGVSKAIAYAQSHPASDVIKVYSDWLTKHDREKEIAIMNFWTTSGVANAGGAISDSEFGRWITWLEKTGKLDKGSAEASDFYTNELNPYAKDIKPASEAAVE